MDRQQLERKADQIEMVLHEHRVPAQVTGGHVTPRWVQFLVTPNPGINISRIESLSREIAVALGAPNACVTTQGNSVRIDVPRTDPQPLKLFPLCARIPATRIPFGTAILGLADDGAPLLIRLPSPEVAHVLVAGATGSGKSALLQTAIMSLALHHHRRQMQFVLIACSGVAGIDPKNRALEAMSGLPHLLRPIVSESAQVMAALTQLDQVLSLREQSRATNPLLVLVIDELSDLVHATGADGANVLTRLLARGREAGIHVIAATRMLEGLRKPVSADLDPFKSSFSVRLVGRVVSAADARVAAGVGGTSAEKLAGRGDFVAVYGPGLIRFQAAYISSSEIEASVQQLAQGIRGDEIIQSARPTLVSAAPRSSASLSVMDSAVYALPGVDTRPV